MKFLFLGICVVTLAISTCAMEVVLDGAAGGKRFDGIGAVSAGGATSVLLKDYPEPQRSQVLDLLFKPKFGASMSALLVEVPGDGNSTQGAEPSHMHTRDDLNCSRGYEWWLMREAKKRNPDLTLDACAWSCPGWVGDGHFWTQDMCDYYVKWILGLKSIYGLNLDAIGCRNESGVDLAFIKRFRATLNASGLEKVRLHGFDNWGATKFDWTTNLNTDLELRQAVDIISNHVLWQGEPDGNPTPGFVQKLAAALGKPVWNTEEHIYKEGYDCEISMVQSFNENFIRSGATKIVNWYLVASLYPIEAYPENPGAMIARTPWSGYYQIREALWGYAHYGQFSKVGWEYLNGGCGWLTNGGSFVTLKSPGKDYSVMIETKDAKSVQSVTFKITGGLSTGKLCVWRSNARDQFIPQASIRPEHGVFTLILETNAVYSLSTTTGQQKGSFASLPADTRFPFPYYETFDEYDSPKQFGYLPHYTADIASIFEIVDRPDGAGKCLRQVIDQQTQCWNAEWLPHTIIGDERWQDYEVSADVYLDHGGWAGVMGRISAAGNFNSGFPTGYYLRLAENGSCALFAVGDPKGKSDGEQLAASPAANLAGHQWHNVKLQFSGNRLSGLVDGIRVLSITNNLYTHGMAGLIAGNSQARNTAYFDNLLINSVGGKTPMPTMFPPKQQPIYP